MNGHYSVTVISVHSFGFSPLSAEYNEQKLDLVLKELFRILKSSRRHGEVVRDCHVIIKDASVARLQDKGSDVQQVKLRSACGCTRAREH